MSLVPAPAVEEGERLLTTLRSTVDPDTNRPIEALNSRANPAYVCAALAIRRSHPTAQKGNGEPNYMGAARMYFAADQLNANSGSMVKGWLEKLDKLDQVSRQATLATDLAELDLNELGPTLSQMMDVPQDSPPISVLPSPPYTTTEPSDAASTASSALPETREERLAQALSKLHISSSVQAIRVPYSSDTNYHDYDVVLRARDDYLRAGKGNLDKVAAEFARVLRAEQLRLAMKLAASTAEPITRSALQQKSALQDFTSNDDARCTGFIHGTSSLDCDQLVTSIVIAIGQLSSISSRRGVPPTFRESRSHPKVPRGTVHLSKLHEKGGSGICIGCWRGHICHRTPTSPARGSVCPREGFPRGLEQVVSERSLSAT